jgi:hypothetical protein
LQIFAITADQSIDSRFNSFNIHSIYMRGSRLAEMPDNDCPANPLNLIRVIPAKGARSDHAATSAHGFFIFP